MKNTKLTAEERLMVSLVVLGYQKREIAARLSLSRSDVSEGLQRIFEKLSVADPLELVFYAFDQKI